MGLFNASVDLNPHQIDAALFALRSPVTKGAILADEVGLGKTIEAGIVLCQYWAEQRRNLLILCPALLRRQWSIELEEKFDLPSIIVDSQRYREAQRGGVINPFQAGRNVVICSFNFASRMEIDLASIDWDVVVIDEAHRLRGAYRESNRMGQALKRALHSRRKILLTATPLQNSLMELYGLASIIDEHIFGEATTFRSMYMSKDPDLEDLRERLRGFSRRTLREHVQEYIRYTQRRPITTPFRPSDNEHDLYLAISDFLLRDDTYSIPAQQRQLTLLVLRKLLASSSRAVAATLETMKRRLVRMKEDVPEEQGWLQQIIDKEEMEELLEEEEPEISNGDGRCRSIDPALLDAEIRELETYINWARSIGIDSKTRALLTAIETGFAEMGKLGAERKALIFTESRRTQEYVRDFLEANGYMGKVVLFNGSNGGPEATQIYDRWLRENAGTGRVTGARGIDRRMSLIDHFRDRGEIMIATEAAAEGVNLQFCSLVINYDLPWNPQRIEQRIGRCHRYGQKYDVVVVNFLNERNEADRRVLQLLTEKFQLFTGIFGASDEVLGTVESGVDFEKRILEIYQTCRTSDEISSEFVKLQKEMEESIRVRLDETRRILLENFDQDVHQRLKLRLDDTRKHLDRFSVIFWSLTRFVLQGRARFNDAIHSFDLMRPPWEAIRTGRYHLIDKEMPQSAGEFLYRPSHPLGEFVIESGKNYPTPLAEIIFDVTGHSVRIFELEAFKGKSGWLLLQRISVESLDTEEHLLFSAFTDAGDSLGQETCEKLFLCDGSMRLLDTVTEVPVARLEEEGSRHVSAKVARAMERDNELYREACIRLDKWAEDQRAAANDALEKTKSQIKLLTRQSRLAETLAEQHVFRQDLAELNRKCRRQRQQIFDEEDEIAQRHDLLVQEIEQRMRQKTEIERLFVVRWRVN